MTLPGFDLPAEAPPPKQTAGQKARALIAVGRHPLTGTLLREGDETCGGCAHLVSRSWANRYLKCEQFETRSPTTDVRRWWPACRNWLPREGSNLGAPA